MLYRKIAIALCLLTCLGAFGLPVCAAPDVATLTSAYWGFRLSVPVGWDVMPDAQQGVTQPVEQAKLVALLQRHHKELKPKDVRRPHCMVEGLPTGLPGRATPEQFAMITKSLGAGKTLTNERIVAASEDTSEDVGALAKAIASATPGTVHADPQTRRFWLIADGTGEEGHQVRSLSAGVLLNNGAMAALNCYADRAQFRQDAIEFGAIFASLYDTN
jgi:hypothetical protein